MFVDDPGIELMLILQLAAAVIAAIAWARVWQNPVQGRIKWAAGASACTFAVLAGLIAFLFDTSI